MKNQKLAAAFAALTLAASMGTMALAETDLDRVQSMVEAGQVSDLVAELTANPEMLGLTGSLGNALRNFYAAPSASTMASIENLSSGTFAVAQDMMSDAGGSDNSIY